jgi:hypothetical protein
MNRTKQNHFKNPNEAETVKVKKKSFETELRKTLILLTKQNLTKINKPKERTLENNCRGIFFFS